MELRFLFLLIGTWCFQVKPSSSSIILVDDGTDSSSGDCTTYGSGTCNLRAAISYANTLGSFPTIQMDSSLVHYITESTSITVSDSMMVGSDSSTLPAQIVSQGSNSGSLFSLNTGITMEISRLNISDFVEASTGGGVFNLTSGANLNLTNSIFLKNSATSVGGGVIYSPGSSNVYIEDCLFEGNFVDNSDVSGGVMYLGSSSSLTTVNSVFTSNTADDNHAVIYLDDSSWHASDCNFTKNDASDEGGVGYITSSETSFTSCHFESNSGRGAGVFDALSSTLEFKNCSFQENTATSTSSSRQGGVLYVDDCTVLITDSFFLQNAGSGYGGVIGADESILTVYNSSFIENTVTTKGVVLYVDDCTVLIKDSIFLRNAGDDDGGVIGADDSTLTIHNSSFHENTVSDEGGVLDLDGSSGNMVFTLENCIFTRNRASEGSVLYLDQSGSTGTIKNCTFDSNSATNYGAIALLEATATISDSFFFNNSATNYGAIALLEATATISDSFFFNNSAGSGGGGVWIDDAELEMFNCSFHRNKVYDSSSSSGGGAFYIQGSTSSTATFNYCTFEDNTSAKNGGAMYLKGSQSTSSSRISVAMSSFTGNYADYEGGAIYIEEAYADVSSSAFTGNSHGDLAFDGGGAIYAYSDDSDVNSTLKNCNFTNNRSPMFGGALYVKSVALALQKLVLEKNEALKGGAIYVQEDYGTGLELKDSIIVGNEAQEQGGALYLDATQGAALSNSRLALNSATLAGGALFSSKASITVQDSEFYGNKAKLGGALYLEESSTINATDTQYTSNEAENGGVLFADTSSSVFDQRGTFRGNLASKGNAGVFFVLNGILTIVDGYFEGCKATKGAGGAVYAEAAALRVANTSAVGCAGLTGGAVASWGAAVDLTGSTFARNAASQDGGAMYLVASTIQARECVFEQNKADFDGGALYLLRSSVNASMTDLLNNTAERSGGGGMLVWDLGSTGAARFGGGCRVAGNACGGAGGGLAALAENVAGGQALPVLSLRGATVSRNKASGLGGGGIYVDTVDFKSTSSNFTENQASGGTGGAIYSQGSYASPSVAMAGGRLIQNKAGEIAGAFCFDNSQQVSLRNILVRSNTAPDASAGLFNAADSVYIEGGSFDYNRPNQTASQSQSIDPKDSSAFSRGALALENVADGTLTGVNFTNNGGRNFSNGGAVHLEDSQVALSDCLFASNAGGYGGALYSGGTRAPSSSSLAGRRLSSACASGASLSVRGSQFHGNRAFVGGAVFWAEDEPCNVTDSNGYSWNTAFFYGDDVASPSHSLEAIADSDDTTVYSGAEVDWDIEVCFKDYYDEKVITEGTSRTVIASANAGSAELGGDLYQVAEDGCSTFDNLELSFTPGNSTSIVFDAGGISQENHGKVAVTAAGCEPGQVLPEGTAVCVTCPYGEYSWENDATECTSCPDGAACWGGDRLKAKKGYWRLNGTSGRCDSWDSTCDLYECHVEEACEGVKTLGMRFQATKGATFVKAKSSVGDELEVNDILIIYGERLLVTGISNDGKTIDVNGTYTGASLSGATAQVDYEEQCHKYYEGNGCRKCIMGYGSNFSGECKKCPGDLGLATFIVILGILGLVTVALILVYFQVHATRDSVITIYVKITVSYFQMMALLSSFGIDWPDSIEDAFSWLDLVGFFGDQLISVDCLVNQYSFESSVPQFYAKFICFMLIPVACILVPGIFWWFYHHHRRVAIEHEDWHLTREDFLGIYEAWDEIDAESAAALIREQGHKLDLPSTQAMIVAMEKDNKNTVPTAEDFKRFFIMQKGKNHLDFFVTSTIILLFICYSNITRYIVKAFTCEKLGATVKEDDPTQTETFYYLEEDLDVRCFNQTYFLWTGLLVFPCFCLFVVGIPTLGSYLMYGVQDKLENKHVFQMYGFLYKGFQDQFYYWEMVIMLRKVVFVFISVFVSHIGGVLTALSGFFVTSFFLVLQKAANPYITQKLNRLETLALLCVVATYLCGLFFLDDNLAGYAHLRLFFVVVVFLLNGLYLFFAGWLLACEVALVELPRLRKKGKLKFLDKCGLVLKSEGADQQREGRADDLWRRGGPNRARARPGPKGGGGGASVGGGGGSPRTGEGGERGSLLLDGEEQGHGPPPAGSGARQHERERLASAEVAREQRLARQASEERARFSRQQSRASPRLAFDSRMVSMKVISPSLNTVRNQDAKDWENGKEETKGDLL